MKKFTVFCFLAIFACCFAGLQPTYIKVDASKCGKHSPSVEKKFMKNEYIHQTGGSEPFSGFTIDFNDMDDSKTSEIKLAVMDNANFNLFQAGKDYSSYSVEQDTCMIQFLQFDEENNYYVVAMCLKGECHARLAVADDHCSKKTKSQCMDDFSCGWCEDIGINDEPNNFCVPDHKGAPKYSILCGTYSSKFGTYMMYLLIFSLCVVCCSCCLVGCYSLKSCNKRRRPQPTNFIQQPVMLNVQGSGASFGYEKV